MLQRRRRARGGGERRSGGQRRARRVGGAREGGRRLADRDLRVLAALRRAWGTREGRSANTRSAGRPHAPSSGSAEVRGAIRSRESRYRAADVARWRHAPVAAAAWRRTGALTLQGLDAALVNSSMQVLCCEAHCELQKEWTTAFGRATSTRNRPPCCFCGKSSQPNAPCLTAPRLALSEVLPAQSYQDLRSAYKAPTCRLPSHHPSAVALHCVCMLPCRPFTAVVCTLTTAFTVRIHTLTCLPSRKAVQL